MDSALNSALFPDHLCAVEIDAPITQFRQANSHFLEWLNSQYQQGAPITRLVHARAAFVDRLLALLWQKCGLQAHAELSLVAVGGYGRGELHPHSDVDLLILAKRSLADSVKPLISDFVTNLWDVRLDIGQSVRTVKECVKLGKDDVTIATNLLESRLICGCDVTFDKLTVALSSKRFWPSDKLYSAKLAEQEARHDQFHDSGYSLEPNVKSNPGCLRDIQTIGWVAKSHFKVHSLYELVEHDFLTSDEHQELMECQTFLWQVRFALHMVTNRAENRLLFEHQPLVATALGYTDAGNVAVEKMMKRFYQTVRRVHELNDMLMQLFDEAILGSTRKLKITPIDGDFQKRGHLIEAVSDTLFFDRPESMLDLFLHIGDDPEITGIYAATVRQLRAARRSYPGFFCDQASFRSKFQELLRHPRGMGRPLSRMHKHSMLAYYFPEWHDIVGQMQFDLFHAYTVDEHTFRLMQNLYHFIRPKQNPDPYPLCGELIKQMAKPQVLFLAGLFHDIAKGRGGDHSELGAVDAYDFARRHQFNDGDARTIAWLVQNHLLMSVTAQKRDIYDPEVISEFAEAVQEEKRLNYLYCLTVADIRATNDNLWNNWKAALLQELYFATQKALRRGLERPIEMETKIAEHRSEAGRLLLEASDGFSQRDVKALWSRFFADYFARFTPEQIAWHSRHMLKHDLKQGPLVLISRQLTRGGTEIFICAEDRPHLFARTVALLDKKGLNIHDAQIMNTRDGLTLDSFVVLEQDGEPLTAPARISEVTQALRQTLMSEQPAEMPNRRLSRQMRHFKVEPKVTFLNQEDNSRSMLELVALDVPGLLATVSNLFQQLELSLHAAKITTVGERAEDFFILCSKEGGALSEEQRAQLKQQLEAALEVPPHP